MVRYAARACRQRGRISGAVPANHDAPDREPRRRRGISGLATLEATLVTIDPTFAYRASASERQDRMARGVTARRGDRRGELSAVLRLMRRLPAARPTPALEHGRLTSNVSLFAEPASTLASDLLKRTRRTSSAPPRHMAVLLRDADSRRSRVGGAVPAAAYGLLIIAVVMGIRVVCDLPPRPRLATSRIDSHRHLAPRGLSPLARIPPPRWRHAGRRHRRGAD